MSELITYCLGTGPIKWHNGCFETALEALRYLANNDRPIGGQEKFNAEHLFQIADELEISVQGDYPRSAAAPEKTTGMTFSEALEAMKAGKKVRIKGWIGKDDYLIVRDNRMYGEDDGEHHTAPYAWIFATNWEIYNEPKTPRQIAEEEFEVWWSSHIGKGIVSSSARDAWLAAKGIND